MSTADGSVVSVRSRRGLLEWVLRVLTAAGLAVDAYVHFDLAASYDTNAAAISQGALFRIEGALAAIAAVLVLLVRARIVALLAFFVAAGGVGAVLVYQYVDVGPIGPLPDMYEPFWYPQKAYSAVAEASAAVTALLLLLMYRRKMPPETGRR